ncbi:hypothetical protein ELI36_32995 [Rhizobium ruizarguesonis]|jgi:hypothetical protein|uniref:hypothetical protein n=1 Tax=Rhizobium ruizarguesonis TaxID=2081791 RepID=UPI00103143A4|nr:hypothetical protein [Rhizobium ruizarguesonis]TAV21355.1 hypothetical protein ELI36_32995 [Rhizobium ruizarguesonis]TAW09983.1 hypothetical protein ELI26_10705 [Rhizobium ruizarguesonis]
MAAKKTVTLSEKDKEIIEFIDRIGAVGQVRVLIEGECFLVTVAKERVTDAGRNFLTRGGRDE